ncbi:transposable element, partial [Pseudoloma neurophilia]
MRKLCEFKADNWKRMVKNTTDAINYSFNRAIGTSPYILKYGRTPSFEIDKKHQIQVKYENQEILRQNIEKNRENYRKAIEKGKVERKITFNIGDKVLVYRKATNKMAANWIPGFTIS